jgi:hypothetical protein
MSFIVHYLQVLFYITFYVCGKANAEVPLQALIALAFILYFSLYVSENDAGIMRTMFFYSFG